MLKVEEEFFDKKKSNAKKELEKVKHLIKIISKTPSEESIRKEQKTESIA